MGEQYERNSVSLTSREHILNVRNIIFQIVDIYIILYIHLKAVIQSNTWLGPK